MNGYLTKPVERHELTSALSNWLPGDRRAKARTAAPAIGDSVGAIDQAALAELGRQIGNANLNTVVGTFRNEVESRWHALENAASSDEKSRQAHTLASTCRSFGLPSVADKLACIERHARSGGIDEPPSIAETGRELKAGVEALVTALRAFDEPDAPAPGGGTAEQAVK